MYSIDKETVESARVVDGAFAVAGSGMWVDEDDTIWVVNRWGEVFALAEGADVFERVYEGQDLAEAMGNAGSAGDLMIRGDRNPVTGEYWGVATSWGGSPVSPILRFSIGRDEVEFHGILGTDLGSVFDVHGLAFAPR